MLDWLTNSTIFYLGLLVTGLILMAVAAQVFKRQREHEWARVARHLGLKLTLVENGPVVRGQLQGRRVELKVAPEGSDHAGGVVVVIASVGVAGLPEDMQAEAVPGVIGDLTNLTENHFLTGDELFDSNVHVQGENSQVLRRYWTEHRREAFLRLVKAENYDRLVLQGKWLSAELRSATSDHHQLEELLQVLLKTSQEIDSLSAVQY